MREPEPHYAREGQQFSAYQHSRHRLRKLNQRSLGQRDLDPEVFETLSHACRQMMKSVEQEDLSRAKSLCQN